MPGSVDPWRAILGLIAESVDTEKPLQTEQMLYTDFTDKHGLNQGKMAQPDLMWLTASNQFDACYAKPA